MPERNANHSVICEENEESIQNQNRVKNIIGIIIEYRELFWELSKWSLRISTSRIGLEKNQNSIRGNENNSEK